MIVSYAADACARSNWWLIIGLTSTRFVAMSRRNSSMFRFSVHRT